MFAYTTALNSKIKDKSNILSYMRKRQIISSLFHSTFKIIKCVFVFGLHTKKKKEHTANVFPCKDGIDA